MRRPGHSRSSLSRALKGTATCGAALALCLTSLPAWATDAPTDPNEAGASSSSAPAQSGDAAAPGTPGDEANAPATVPAPATTPESGAASPSEPAQSTPAPGPEATAPSGAEADPAPTAVSGANSATANASGITPIPEIQKVGKEDDSALINTNVTTTGVVTAVFPRDESGLTATLDGFYIQTPGTGGAWDPARASSDAVFVYVGKGKLQLPEVGQCVTVKGKVAEYVRLPKKNNKKQEVLPSHQSLTQLVSPKVTQETGCAAVTPTPLTSVPTDAQKEALEGMLVAPQGTWTITDNYKANQEGTLTLTPGTEPLKQATDVVAPGEEAREYEAANAAKAIVLDDGTATYLQSKNAQGVPFAYISNAMPARVGYHLQFTKPVLLDSRDNGFVFQPTQMVAANPDRSPVTITGQRPTAPTVDGAVKVATFNVLNYFIHLGEDEAGCKAYKDREGNGLTAKDCDVRGAHTQAAFQNQQAKIVKAISALNADVVALEEIENPIGAGAGTDRDAALKALVAALNTAAGSEVWAPVLSPSVVPDNEDAIRVAFIYKKAAVAPVGESKILDHDIFTGLARQPLAQEFAPVVTDAQEGTNFVVIVNHFKSKGSLSKVPGMDNKDKGDGQGNNNPLRVEQAKALATFAQQFAAKPTLLVGDFNAYSKEDPIRVLTEAGWVHKSGNTSASYVYGGRVGSLDHVLANAAADKVVAGVASWALNAHEAVAFEYSRANTNAHLKFEADNPYRSSDHNPELVGLNVVKDKQVQPKPNPDQPQSKPDQPQSEGKPTPDQPQSEGKPTPDQPQSKPDQPQKDKKPQSDQDPSLNIGPDGQNPKGDSQNPKGDGQTPKADAKDSQTKGQEGKVSASKKGAGKLASTGANGLSLALAAAALSALAGVGLVLRRRA